METITTTAMYRSLVHAATAVWDLCHEHEKHAGEYAASQIRLWGELRTGEGPLLDHAREAMALSYEARQLMREYRELRGDNDA